MSVILIKHFYFQVMNVFVEVLKKNLWVKSFSFNKAKTEAFLENRGHNCVGIE